MQVTLWIVAVFHFSGHLVLCMGPCRDTMSPGNALELRNQEGKHLGFITNCAILKRDYPQICRQPQGKAKCCKTCMNIDTGCLDDPASRFMLEGSSQSYSCEEFIEMDPCNCREVIKNENAKNVLVKKTCCASCKNIDVSNCNCRDSVTPGLPVVLSNGIQIKSCEELVRNYPELCSRYGKARSRCCRSCAGVSTRCLDTRFKTWNIDGEMLECPRLVARDKCYCKLGAVKKECCVSCSNNQDLSDCCINDPNYTATISVRKYGKCESCTCAQLFSKGLAFIRRACKSKRKAREHCCKACREIGM